MRGKGGIKLYGPYQHRGQWRVIRRQPGKPDTAVPFATKEEALAELSKARGEIEGKTVMAAIDDFDAYLRDNSKSTALREHTRRCLNRITRVKEDGDFLLAHLSPARARRLYQALVIEYAVATHQASLERARTWCAWLQKSGLMPGVNPFEGVEKVGKASKGKPQLRIDESRRLVDHCMSVAAEKPEAVAVLCCLIMGMRVSEVVGLRGRDIDDGGRVIWIDKGKTENAQRHLEAPDFLAAHLTRLAAIAGPESRLFPAWRHWVNRRLADLCDAAGVPAVTPHGLRGTHSTLAVRGGSSSSLVMDALAEAARSMGHGSTAVTSGSYVKPGTSERARAGRVLTVLAGGKRG
jgi:integrase